MTNEYKGEGKITLAGEEYTLVYDWAAIADLCGKFKTDLMGLALIVQKQDVTKFPDMIAAGLKKKHPEMTAKKVIEASPPIRKAAEAIDGALAVALWGPEGAPKGDEPTEKPEEDEEKKT